MVTKVSNLFLNNRLLYVLVCTREFVFFSFFDSVFLSFVLFFFCLRIKNVSCYFHNFDNSKYNWYLVFFLGMWLLIYEKDLSISDFKPQYNPQYKSQYYNNYNNYKGKYNNFLKCFSFSPKFLLWIFIIYLLWEIRK